MIVNHTTYRTPRVLTKQEFNSCKAYVEKEIIAYVYSGAKQFVVKDIFGYINSDWSSAHPQIQCIYDAWVSHYAKTKGGRWTCDEIYCEAFKQAGISLGHIVKQACRDIPDIKFRVKNDTWWNLVYRVVK